jgi:hypothetical protein
MYPYNETVKPTGYNSEKIFIIPHGSAKQPSSGITVIQQEDLNDHYMLEDKMILRITCWDHSSSQADVSADSIQDVAIEYDYFQTAALMNCIEYKKHVKLCSISSKISLNICLLLLKN